MKPKRGRQWLMIPAIMSTITLIGCDSQQTEQRNAQLRQMGMAFHSYHSAYKRLPKAEEWRFAIAPYIENDSGAQLPPVESAEQLPSCFGAARGDSGETNIFAIVESDSAFPPASDPTRFRDFRDGIAMTILLIELPNRNVKLTENKNMTRAEALTALRELETGEVAHFLMADGAVQAFSGQIEEELFDALTTRDGGEDMYSLF